LRAPHAPNHLGQLRRNHWGDTVGIVLAAFIDVASELVFILNSARLRPQRSGGLAWQS
jgi:hypothetical protein